MAESHTSTDVADASHLGGRKAAKYAVEAIGAVFMTSYSW